MPHCSRRTSVAQTTGVMGGASGILTPGKEIRQECAWNGGPADHMHGVLCMCDVLLRLSALGSMWGKRDSTSLSAVLTDRPYVTDRIMRPAVLETVEEP